MNFPTDFISFSYIGMIIAAYIVTYIYGINNWTGPISDKLTTIYLILYSFGLTVSSIYANGYILIFPHLARTGILMLFLMNSVIYLALEKGILNKKLTRPDIWHLLPTIIYTINFIPFFIKSTEEKVNILITNKHSLYLEGWFLPAHAVLVICFVQIIFYLIIIYKKFIEHETNSNSHNFLSKAKLFWGITAFHSLVIFTTAYGMYSGEIRGSYHIIYNLGNIVFFYLFLSQPELVFSRAMKKIKS